MLDHVNFRDWDYYVDLWADYNDSSAALHAEPGDTFNGVLVTADMSKLVRTFMALHMIPALRAEATQHLSACTLYGYFRGKYAGALIGRAFWLRLTQFLGQYWMECSCGIG